MFDSVLQQLSGDNIGNLAENELHGHLDNLVGQASPDQTTGAIGEALNRIGPGGFAQSVQGAARSQSPEGRGQIGSLLMQAIQHGGGNSQNVLGSLGIGAQSPSQMSHGELGQLAGYVAQNHSGDLATLIGGNSGSGGMGAEAIKLLGTPMVQQTAMRLVQHFV